MTLFTHHKLTATATATATALVLSLSLLLAACGPSGPSTVETDVSFPEGEDAPGAENPNRAGELQEPTAPETPRTREGEDVRQIPISPPPEKKEEECPAFDEC